MYKYMYKLYLYFAENNAYAHVGPRIRKYCTAMLVIKAWNMWQRSFSKIMQQNKDRRQYGT